MAAAIALLSAQLAIGQPFPWPVETVWYNPALCPESPINCFDPREWWKMSAGHDAREWYGLAAACPMEIPLLTRVHIGGSWRGLADGDKICLDHGGAIKARDDGTLLLDLLSETPVWHERLWVEIVPPPVGSPSAD